MFLQRERLPTETVAGMAVRGIAIETSGREGSVAASVGGETVAMERFAHGLKHAAGLVPMVGRVIAAAGWTEDEVAEVYISAGPGSFTGLRIGITLVKTWGVVKGVPVVAVPSVRVIVENLGAEVQHAAVVLDAKRGQVFSAGYSRVAGAWEETRAARLARLAEVLAESPRPLVLTGEGLGYHAVPAGVEGVGLAAAELWAGRAEKLATVGHAWARAGKFCDVEALVPTYVRLAEAEEKWRLERGLPI
jgi:tRNA threonylcarbamoyladenosine biosynthesis protein TsaB